LTLSDENLSKIYSMDFQQNLLVAGGHGGRVSIFGKSDIVMSWKAHFGWISGVSFVKKLLLTSSNDKNMILWDLNYQKGEKIPRKF
jgi:WD40 repeat protein